jgi:cytidylate kinase
MLGETIPVIAIDGPSGSGKGTISRAVATQLGWHLLDSGALYRVLALSALGSGIPEDRVDELAAEARALDVRFETAAGGGERILLNGEDVSQEVRTEECGDMASKIALHSQVRGALLSLQRSFQRPPGLVADGRDMGSVVFPSAGLKVFLTASPEERALRRYKQLKEKGIDVSLPALSTDIAERDRRDAEREAAPLRPSPDAVTLDTTGLSISEVVEGVLDLARQAFGGP